MKSEKELFYKALFENIYKYVYFRVGNKHEAEDITSETVARILEKKDLSQVQNINYFAIGIARNVMVDTFNKNIKSTNLPEVEQFDILHEDISLDESVLTDEMIDLIKREMKSLDEITAEIIALRVWQNLQFNEIAQITDLKEMTVKQRFYRGVETLKETLNKPKTSYKAYSFTLPIILAGAKALFTTSEFAAAGSFISGLTSKAITLNIILPNMAISTITGGAKAAGGFLSTTSAKIVAVLIGSGTIIGGGFVVTNLPDNTNDNSSNKIQVENVVSHAGTQVEAIKLKEFQSERYEVYFRYPEEMGETNVKFTPEYFNNEYVSFSNSTVKVGYWRFEGGFGGPQLFKETLTTKEGKSFTLTYASDHADPAKFVVAQYYDFVASVTITTDDQTEKGLEDIKTIISNFEVDLSEAKDHFENEYRGKVLNFSSERFNLEFEYPEHFGETETNFLDTDQAITGNISCTSETVTFAYGTALNVRSVNGPFECDGAGGGNLYEAYTLTTENGLAAEVIVNDSSSNNAFGNTIVNIKSSDASYRLRIQWQLPLNSSKSTISDQAKADLQKLIGSIVFEEGLK